MTPIKRREKANIIPTPIFVASRVILGFSRSSLLTGTRTPCPLYLVLAKALEIKTAPIIARILPRVVAGASWERMSAAFPWMDSA